MNLLITNNGSFKEKANGNDAVNDNDNIASDNEANTPEESWNSESESSDGEDDEMESDEQFKSDVKAALGDSAQKSEDENQYEVLMETPFITPLLYSGVFVSFFSFFFLNFFGEVKAG